MDPWIIFGQIRGCVQLSEFVLANAKSGVELNHLAKKEEEILGHTDSNHNLIRWFGS